MRTIAYLRVSTQEQGDSRLGLEAQQEDIYKNHGLAMAYFEDIGSGKAMTDRPQLQIALAMLRDKQADQLIVAKLDRLSRSLLDLVTILETSRRQGWALIALDIGLDTSTPAGEAMFGMMAVWAQLKRRMISQRTKDGLAAARAAGVRLGAPRTIPNHLREKAIELRGKNWSYEAIGRHVGLGWTTVRKMCLSEDQ